MDYINTPKIIWNTGSLTYGVPVSKQLNAIAEDPTTNTDVSNQGTFTYTENGNDILAGTILNTGQHTLVISLLNIQLFS